MPTTNSPWLPGIPCWVDAQLDDVAAAGEFYSALFGWEIGPAAPDAGGYTIARLAGHSAAGLGPKGMPMPSVWTTYLAVESADETAAKVTAAGGSLLAGPFDVMDAGRMFVATDPTGAVFAVWEAKSNPGAQIYNEPGAFCWNELYTRDHARAKQFYTDVFGYTYSEMPDGDGPAYTLCAVPGREDPIAGIFDMVGHGMPDEIPAHWLTWFVVEDTDASFAQALGLAATEAMAPFDSPVGRLAVICGPQGEYFGILTPPAAG